jgi:hypothetical protein
VKVGIEWEELCFGGLRGNRGVGDGAGETYGKRVFWGRWVLIIERVGGFHMDVGCGAMFPAVREASNWVDIDQLWGSGDERIETRFWAALWSPLDATEGEGQATRRSHRRPHGLTNTDADRPGRTAVKGRTIGPETEY